MAHRFHLTLVIAGLLIILCSVSNFAQDWPQWRGPNRDGKVEGFINPEKWPAELDQKWQVTVGQGDSTLALVNDRLYVFTIVGSHEIIQCLDAANGEEIWKDKYPVTILNEVPEFEHPGPRSSPAVAEGKVVNVGISGIFSCNDIENGKLLWRKEIFPGSWPRYYIAVSPIIVDGMAIAHLGRQRDGGIVALDLNTGDQIWMWDQDGPQYSSPVLMMMGQTKQLVQMTNRNIVGINVANGSLLWKVPYRSPGLRDFNVATVIIDGQVVIFTGVERGTQAIKIVEQQGKFVPVELWSNSELNPHFTTPVLQDGLLFGMSERGKLYCINAETGETAWRNGETLNPIGLGTIISTGSYLMVVPGSDEMIVYKPNPDRYDEVKRYKIADTNVYAYPVISGKRLFIKDKETLSLWMLE